MLDDALPEARGGFPAELVFAGDQFIITPAGRAEEAARAHAAGDEVRTVIAGYHWFTDWGRDTMISWKVSLSLAGVVWKLDIFCVPSPITFAMGSFQTCSRKAKRKDFIIRADATLWFFHALSRYLHYTEDRTTLHLLLRS